MLPSESDIAKRKKNLEGMLSKLDKDGRSKESDMVMVVRGAIRSAWMRSPTKLSYLLSRSEPDMDPTTRRKWKVRCEKCLEYFSQSEVEVDHKKGNHSLRTPEDFVSYFENILMVSHDDLQVLCKECHGVKTLQEKQNLPSFETAKAHKKAIAIQKGKKDAEWLKEHGIQPGKNKETRKAQIIQKLLEE